MISKRKPIATGADVTPGPGKTAARPKAAVKR